MKYTRRANRPDANYYRETRRRGLGTRRSARPINPTALLVAVVAAVVLVAWMIWR